jgi:hypothetical protein
MSEINYLLFYSQLSISVLGIVFCGTMMIVKNENVNIYLPIFTSLIFAWIPSPVNNHQISTEKVLEKKDTLKDTISRIV